MVVGRWIFNLFVLFTVVGCAAVPEPAPRTPEIAPPPTRSAIEDSDLRALLRDVATSQLCRAVENSFSGLPDSDATGGASGGASPSGGRLWIRECEVATNGDQVVLDVGGPGWVWMNQGDSGFEVRDYLRLSAQIRLTGELDLGYDRDKRVVSVWLTPRQRVEAKVAPIGEVPVRAESVLAKMASVLPAVRERAQQQAQMAVVDDGSALFRDALQKGFTLTADLCTGQIDSMVGALGNGEIPARPYPPDGLRWLSNERARVHPDGLDVAGPWTPGEEPFHLDVEVEDGPGVEVRVVCLEDAEQVVDAFLHRREEPTLTARAYATLAAGESASLDVESSDCPLFMITRHHGEDETPTVVRFRARVADHRSEALVRCEPSPSPLQTPEEPATAPPVEAPVPSAPPSNP